MKYRILTEAEETETPFPGRCEHMRMQEAMARCSVNTAAHYPVGGPMYSRGDPQVGVLPLWPWFGTPQMHLGAVGQSSCSSGNRTS